MSFPIAGPHFGIVVPIKPPARAKSRLAALGDVTRQQLVTAFAHDTVAAARNSPAVDAVLVVTDDVPLAASLRDLGVRVIPDGVEGDLNETLRLGAAEVLREHPGVRIAALFADLPCLRSADLTDALASAAAHERCFVADAESVGSTLVAAHALAVFTPAFGPGSCAAHRELGLVQLDGVSDRLRRDVDTPADLAAAVALGVGPRTSEVVKDCGLA